MQCVTIPASVSVKLGLHKFQRQKGSFVFDKVGIKYKTGLNKVGIEQVSITQIGRLGKMGFDKMGLGKVSIRQNGD